MADIAPTRILLVDDHALFRESVARLLSREPDFDIVAHCASADEALQVLAREPVDLVLLDFDLGQGDGLDFMRQVRATNVTARILIVTAGIAPDQAKGLIRSGISGIFLKRDSAARLAESIRDVLDGKVSFEQKLFLDAMVHQTATDVAAESDRFTTRERTVLSYVFEGLANKEIAARVGVSESSIKATLQQLFSKTGVRTRSQLVRIALERFKHD
ncbi:MAG: response regulator transcription factor [Acidobacteriaceae bacterium]|jgi:DNA-binding NarL/FixJ family response regulator|nr:response regulator transcription factor [Acidobacteriaceae bacterium]